MKDFQQYLQQNYPNANNNDPDTVSLIVKAGQEFCIKEKIELLKNVRREICINYDMRSLPEIISEINYLQKLLNKATSEINYLQKLLNKAP